MVNSLAQRKGASASQIALAWVLAKGQDIVPIPGTKRRKYLEENAGAASVTLTPQEMQQLDVIGELGKVAGPRYSEER